MLTILIGASASGKDAVRKELVEKYGYREIVTTTTRPKRKQEQNGVDYNFISKREFEEGIANGTFFEYRSYNTIRNGKPDVWYYGTPKMQLNPEQDYVAVVDVQGAKDYSAYFGKYECFVVHLHSSEELRTARAMARGSFDKDEWERRLAADRQAFSHDNLESTDTFSVNRNLFNREKQTIENMAKQIAYGSDVYGRASHAEIDEKPCRKWGAERIEFLETLESLRQDIATLQNNLLRYEQLESKLGKREPYPTEFDFEEGLTRLKIW